jgi:hypothetical protein
MNTFPGARPTMIQAGEPTALASDHPDAQRWEASLSELLAPLPDDMTECDAILNARLTAYYANPAPMQE